MKHQIKPFYLKDSN
jgi:transcription initiation factor TFIIH subunit 2